MKNELIVSEFCKSNLKAFTKYAKDYKCQDGEIQIALELNQDGKDNVYRVCKNFAPVATVGLKDVLFISSLYSFIKPKIAKVINESLNALKKTDSIAGRITVFLMKSQTPGQVRMMLYADGTYRRDLSAEEVINLN